MIPGRGQIVNISGSVDHRVAITQRSSALGLRKQPWVVGKQMCVPIKLYLQKQVASEVWPSGCSLKIPGLDLEFAVKPISTA